MQSKNKRAQQAGKNFEVKITKTLLETARQQGGFSIRVTDRLTYSPVHRRVFKQPTPYDHLYFDPTLMMMVECKAIYEGDRFLFGKVNKGEREALLDFHRRGELFLGVVFFAHMSYRKRTTVFYALPITELLKRPSHIKQGELGRAIPIGTPGAPLSRSALRKLRKLCGHNGEDTVRTVRQTNTKTKRKLRLRRHRKAA